MSKKKPKNPTGSRSVELCHQARALYRTIDASTQELAEVVSEMDEEAAQHDDQLLVSVWRALDPVQVGLEHAVQSDEIEPSIRKYLKART